MSWLCLCVKKSNGDALRILKLIDAKEGSAAAVQIQRVYRGKVVRRYCINILFPSLQAARKRRKASICIQGFTRACIARKQRGKSKQLLTLVEVDTNNFPSVTSSLLQTCETIVVMFAELHKTG